MNNSDDILKRILLHMRYDSKNTLSENEEFVEQKKPKISVGKPELISQKPDDVDNEIDVFADEEATQYDTHKDLLGGVLLLPKGTPGKYVDVEKKRNQSLKDFTDEFGSRLLETCQAFVKSGQYTDEATCLALYKARRDSLLKANTVQSFTLNGKNYRSCWDVTRNKSYIPLQDQNFFAGYSDWCESNVMYQPKFMQSKNTTKTIDNAMTPQSAEEMKANKGFTERPGMSLGLSGGKGDEIGGKLGFDLK